MEPKNHPLERKITFPTIIFRSHIKSSRVYLEKVSLGSKCGSLVEGSLKYSKPMPAILLGSFPARSASRVCPVGFLNPLELTRTARHDFLERFE